MSRASRVRQAEAYEQLLEKCRLEAFLHRYPIPAEEAADDASNDEGGQLDSDVNATSEDESSDSVEDSSEEPASDDVESDSEARNMQHRGDEATIGWTDEELALFFPSLARRSRLFPDLISQDLDGSKSTSQVAHLLQCLQLRAELQEEEDKVETLRKAGHSTASTAMRKSRRIAALKTAHEVSDEWLAFEEKQAAALRVWEDLDDGEDQHSPKDSQAGEEEATGVSDGAGGEETIICWDTQVLNALLYLRHHPRTNPQSNEANFIYDVPLAATVEQDILQLFSLPASLAAQLLTSRKLNAKGDARKEGTATSYRAFAALHPAPNTHFGLEKKCEELGWRIIYRGVELGIWAWVELNCENEGALPLGALPKRVRLPLQSTQRGGKSFTQFEEGKLVWLDTVLGHRLAQAAKVQLEAARSAARRRLLSSLLWQEMDFAKGRNGAQAVTDLPGFNLSAYTDIAERKAVKARIMRRIERYGQQAALSMPLGVQKKGRKRKADIEGETDAKKKGRASALGEDHNVVDDGAEADQGRELSQDSGIPNAANAKSSRQGKRQMIGLYRFGQIGISSEEIASLLSPQGRTSLDLFNVPALRGVARHTWRHWEDTSSDFVQGLSHVVLSQLEALLRSYLRRLISRAIGIASNSISSNGDNIDRVGAEEVRLAIQQEQPLYKDQVKSRHVAAASLTQLRSDPPCLYTTEAEQQKELSVQLQGLQSFSASSSHQPVMPSNRSDAVITASHGFTLPISSAYLRLHTSSAHHEDDNAANVAAEEAMFDSEESSVYDDSDQEREVQMRRDERKGVTREPVRSDGRVWDFNERREAKELERWQRLDEVDERNALRYEKHLWARMGFEGGAGRAEQSGRSDDEEEQGGGAEQPDIHEVQTDSEDELLDDEEEHPIVQ